MLVRLLYDLINLITGNLFGKKAQEVYSYIQDQLENNPTECVNPFDFVDGVSYRVKYPLELSKLTIYKLSEIVQNSGFNQITVFNASVISEAKGFCIILLYKDINTPVWI